MWIKPIVGKKLALRHEVKVFERRRELTSMGAGALIDSI
jgi:hypothetical protein